MGPAEAVVVDREVLILVDVTKSVSDADFATMMTGYADSFESSEVIAALASGDLGNIAASLVFYSDKQRQAVGVSWMEISNAAEAGTFADELRAVARPFDKSKTSIAEGMDYAVPLFGTETGGTPNGFESTSQVITMAADGVDDNSPKTGPQGGSREATVAASRDAALASGVDVIDALTVGAMGSVDEYFTNYVVGGGLDGVPGQVQNVTSFAAFNAAAGLQMQAVVPEPAVGVGVALGICLMGLRRRRETRGS